MRQIKVVWRGIFREPIGALNPLGLKMPVTCKVEVHGSKDKWQARNIDGGKPVPYTRLGSHPGALTMRNAVEAAFRSVVEPWQLWGEIPGDKEHVPEWRMLQDHEWKEMTDKGGYRAIFLLTPEDYTHILHSPNVRPDAKVPNAACGADVPPNAFINNKANVRPTCEKCAEVWEKHYQTKETRA